LETETSFFTNGDVLHLPHEGSITAVSYKYKLSDLILKYVKQLRLMLTSQGTIEFLVHRVLMH